MYQIAFVRKQAHYIYNVSGKILIKIHNWGNLHEAVWPRSLKLRKTNWKETHLLFVIPTTFEYDSAHRPNYHSEEPIRRKRGPTADTRGFHPILLNCHVPLPQRALFSHWLINTRFERSPTRDNFTNNNKGQ